MTTKKKEQAKVVSQEQLADGIFSMWIQTEAAGSARPGQFISMYTNDGSKLLPRPISICEIDKEGGKLRVVYRVTGEKTGTEEFSQMKAGDIIPVIGPLGNGFPFEKAEGKKVFLMGGGIGVPPILELAKQMECEKKQIVVGYRDAHTFLKEEFEQAGELYISTEDGSVGTKGNVMDAIRENALEADMIYACGPTPMLRDLFLLYGLSSNGSLFRIIHCKRSQLQLQAGFPYKQVRIIHQNHPRICHGLLLRSIPRVF